MTPFLKYVKEMYFIKYTLGMMSVYLSALYIYAPSNLIRQV